MKHFGKLFSFFAVLVVIGALAGCSAIGASFESSLTKAAQVRIGTVEADVAVLKQRADAADAAILKKAEKADVGAVQKQVASVAASQKETAGQLADTAKALAETKNTVDGQGKDIAGLTSRANQADITVGTKAEKAEVVATHKRISEVAIKTDEKLATLGKSVSNLFGQVASVRTQLVNVKHITGAGIDEVLVLIEGFPRAQYNVAKDEFTAGCSELSDAQKKEIDEKVIKVYQDYFVKIINGLASVEKFVDKKSGKPFAESDKLNRRCASLRAKTVAEYLAKTLNDEFAYVGLGATSDFEPQAKNRSVAAILIKNVRKDGVVQPPAVKLPAAPVPVPPAPQK